jgi:hypothetical protein
MLDFLKKEQIKDAAAAGHHAIQVIRQWAQVAGLQDYLALDGDTTLTPEQANIVRRIVNEIEREEKVSIRSLSQDKIMKYVFLLSDSLQELSREQLHVDKEKGKKLLDKFRSIVS